ncbi:methyltransferase domain-containing protein [candidate division KSB1 bacterium]|nr:methyltransferase domain-containing protein [candidate division KSB1 bacterium]
MSTFWNDRYNEPGYAYGTEPNSFVVEIARDLPPGRLLSLGEGEGRNGVYLAGLGFAVTAVDASDVGLTKARQLATSRGVSLETVVADLSSYPIPPASWDVILSIFCHLPPSVRLPLHRRVVDGLKPGGHFVLEAYTPEQLTYATGGPGDVSMLLKLSDLRAELSGLDFIRAGEQVREVREGTCHTGPASVVQIIARKPSS